MPQFDGGFPRSFQVKNTFIDVEESPKEGTLFSADTARRARSMPPPPMLDTDEEDDSHDGTPVDDEVSSPTSLLGTHYSESPRPTQDRVMFPSRLASWPFIPDPMMVLLPIPPTPTDASKNQSKENDAQNAPKKAKKKLTCCFDSQTGAYRITWYVDARKLDSNDKQAVSPAFEMSWKEWAETKTFKVMLFPEAPPEVRGAYNFKKARGRGYLRLKCEDDLGPKSHFVTMRMSMGEESRGPVKHDFAQSVSCGLPKRNQVWDCKKLCMDARNSMLLVTLDILPSYDLQL